MRRFKFPKSRATFFIGSVVVVPASIVGAQLLQLPAGERRCYFQGAPPILLHANTEATNSLVENTPTLSKTYRPTWWCPNAYMQMLLHDFKKKWGHRSVKLTRQRLDHRDGGLTALDWIDCSQVSNASPLPDDCPIVLMLHTITGRAQDCYGMVSMVSELASRGLRIAVHARRGCGNLPLTTPKFNILGDAEDMHDAVRAIIERFPHAPIVLVGLSAGSGIMVRYLGELGELSASSNIVAAVGVCPGYEIPNAFHNIRPEFEPILVSKLKKHFLIGNKEVLTNDEYAEIYDKVMGAKTVLEFVETAYPYAGTDSVLQYYEVTDSYRVASNIITPTLLVNALDDPVCSCMNIRSELFLSDQQNLILATTPYGGHLAFFEGWSATPWIDRVVGEFVCAALLRHKEQHQ